MKPAICVPWRGGVQSREDVWRALRPHYEATGIPVVTGDSDPDLPFNRSQARNRAAEAAGDADVLLFMDADTYVTDTAVWAAIVQAAANERVVAPYEWYVLVDGAGEETIERIHRQMTGCMAMSRTVFERLGGFDERLDQYGPEDFTMLWSAEVLLGPVMHCAGQLAQSVEHDRKPDEKYLIPHTPLYLRYRDARATVDREAMQCLVDEHRLVTSR